MAYFQEDACVKDMIETGNLKTPALVVAEITRALVRDKIPEEKIGELVGFIRDRSLILDLDFEHAKKTGGLAQREKLHLADAVVYSYASEEEPVLTGDPHFREKKFVQFIA